MNLVLTLFGGAFVAVAAVLLWFRRKISREVGLMTATPTSKAADVAKMAAGSVVELKGPLRCEAPLAGEFSKQACIYYRAVIEREYEHYSRNSKGESQRTTRRETVQSNERFAPCVLEDDSGRVAVDFAGATVEGIESHQRFEPAAGGGVVAAIATGVLGVGDRDLGLRYTETMMPAGIPIYLLGTVLAGGTVGADPSKKTTFVISHKSEEERTKALNRMKLWVTVGAIGCLAAAIGFFVWSALAGPDWPAAQKKSAIEITFTGA